MADVYPTPHPRAERQYAEPVGRPPDAGEHTYETVTDRIASIVLFQTRQPIPWYVMAGIGFLLLNLMMYCITYLLFKGVGIWGINEPSAWGFDIINFVWWIGIGHAGTLISAILLLLRQQWRTSINRFAEAMTLFAVSSAGTLPAAAYRAALGGVLDVPLPEHSGHVAAVPQSAALGRVRRFDVCHRVRRVLVHRPDPRPGEPARPGHKSYAKILFGAGALGWRGSASHWQRYETAYLDPRGAFHAARAFGTQYRLFDFPSASYRDGIPRSSRPTLSPEPCSPGLQWS